ncbi:LRRC49 [Mytilus edulis]|uniref:LRRC49 n=1 Tax=Mytilus edulis TaxID=6550 RepID=A0A8S3RF82_MYTED|nr:LRRC49 [Mytilus edulis]
MNDEVTELSSLKSSFINLKNIFDACIAEGSELHCLVKMEEILENLPRLKIKYPNLAKITHTSISFQPNNTISDVTSLGRITLKGSSMTCPKIMRKVNFHSGKVKLLFTIDVVGGSQISGIFLNGFILLSDYENRKVIKYDDKGTQIGERKITGKPSDVTKVDDMNIAVATNSAKIHLINAETLTLNKTITATVSVFGLCFVDKEYVTAHYQSKQISFLDASFKNIWT